MDPGQHHQSYSHHLMDLPHQLPSATKTLTAQCYCKSVQFTITVATSALPLPAHLCHCSVCRYTHGTPCTFHAPLPRGIVPEFIAPSSIETSLTGYEHSEALSTRFFCSTCGCHIGDRDLPGSNQSPGITDDPEHLEWRVAISMFSPPDQYSGLQYQDIFQIRSHTHANPISSPGGLYNWLPEIGSRPIKIWNPSGPPEPARELSPETRGSGLDHLLAQCQCAGVSFRIARPQAVLSNPSLKQGWKDYIRRYLPPTLSDPGTSADANKYSAILDLCDDCRLVSGAHAIGWIFVPLAELRPSIGTELVHGTLKTFESSKGVKRAFCGVCGAAVFYLHEERTWESDDITAPGEKHMIVDIATGILRAPGGVAAEDWLVWRTGRLAWYKSGERYDAAFAKSLAKGLAEWGTKTHGQAVKFDIPH